MEYSGFSGYRTWAEIDLDNLVHNYKFVRDRVFPAEVLCVVKADAYGHGAPRIAEALAEAGASGFAVSGAEEALQLRRHGITLPILILGYVSPERIRELAENDITLTIGDMQLAREYAAALGETVCKMHVKVDTGMKRLGLNPQSAAEDIGTLAVIPCFDIEGIFTHFSISDEPVGAGFTDCQLRQFLDLLRDLRLGGIEIPKTHCANSGGIISYPEAYVSMVRPGIILYGSNPTEEALPLRPVMSLRTHITQITTVGRGETVGYGRTWTASRESRIATLAIGYADGLPRNLSGKLEVLINGQRAPLAGRICMDMCMADVTDIPTASPGDTVTVIGADGGASQSARDVAALIGTISYELFCVVGGRVPRVYIKDGQVIDELCYIDNL